MEEPIPQEEKMKEYKTVCAKLGIVMCVYFICRFSAGVIVTFIANIGINNTALTYIIQTVVLIILIYLVPTIIALFLFDRVIGYFKENSRLKKLYEKPKRLAKNLGNFPAMYGLGFGINILTILIFYLIRVLSRSLDIGLEIQRFFEPLAFEPPKDLVSAIVLVFITVVVAAVIEEFLVRGIMYDALKPYGNGVAIIISSLIFGLMHGSIHMLFYTTALGLALGYVRYATDSLLVVTILHAMVNAVAAGLMFFLSLIEITDGDHALINSLSEFYMIAMLALIILGIIAIIKKIPVIKRYKIANDWTEISAKKKMVSFFLSIPVIIMLLMAINEHAGNPLIVFILENM